MILNPGYFEIMDIAIVIFCAIILIRSYQKGLVRKIYDIITVVASFFVAFHFCETLAQRYPFGNLNFVGFEMVMDRVLWFVILFIVTKIIFAFIGMIFHGKRKKGTLSFLNQLGGLAFGAVEVLVILVLLIELFSSGLFYNGSEYVNQGVLNQVNQRIHMIG